MRISSKAKPQSLPWGRYLLIALGLSFLVIVVVLPLVTIFYQAFANGIEAYWTGITAPEARHAIFLTVAIAVLEDQEQGYKLLLSKASASVLTLTRLARLALPKFPAML